MNLKRFILLFAFTLILFSCADYTVKQGTKKKEKKYFSSNGFALIYSDNQFTNKILNKKINNEKNEAMHSFLKRNTMIKIINPLNLKSVETKIYKNAKYPKIYNIVLSKKIASALELDTNNPYVEVIEIKKNKSFIAKKTNTFDEEKYVAGKAPVDEIKMNDLSKTKSKVKKKKYSKSNFTIVINDFYYKDSATKLRDELIKKTKFNNIFVKKINNEKYRLLTGPFKNFNALKNSYISLNNLGFDDLNIDID